MAGAIAQATDPRARIGERYQLVECIRVDGGRQCWRAVDELLRRPVRVWLYTGLDLEVATALRRRLQALHTVRHTGLVTVYDLVDHDDELAVVSEADPARPLADLLRTGQRPSLGTVRSIVSSLAEVLDELHLLGRTVCGLDATNLLLRADGAAILDAPLAGPEREVTRPDIRALEELARALVLGTPPRSDVPAAARLAVDRLSGVGDRFRSARDFAGNLASAIAFDDRTEVLPRDRWIALRRAAAERARARAVAVALVAAVSVAAGGLVATAATRPPDRATSPTVAIARPTPNTTTSPAASRPAAAGTGSGTPSVLGMQRDDAARALMGAGAGSVIWRTEPLARGITRVVRQEPAPGQPLARGAAVTVHLDSASQR